MRFWRRREKEQEKKSLYDVFFDKKRGVVSLREKVYVLKFYPGKTLRYIKSHPLIFGVAFFFIIILIFGIFSPSSKASVTKIYSTKCLGGWDNPELAQGAPEVQGGEAGFSSKNSAVLKNTSGQIFCGGFAGEEPLTEVPKKLTLHISWLVTDEEIKEPTVEDTIDSTLEKSDAPIIIDNSGTLTETNPTDNTTAPPTDTTTTPTDNTNSTEISPTETPAPDAGPVSFFWHSLFQTARAQDLAPSDATPPTDTSTTDTIPTPSDNSIGGVGTPTPSDVGAPTQTETSPPPSPEILPGSLTPNNTDANAVPEDQSNVVKEPPSSGDFLEVLYTLDGEHWESLGKVSRQNWRDASLDIPIPYLSWDNISKVQISFKSIDTIDQPPIVYLDSAWLEVESELAQPETPQPEVLMEDSEYVSTDKPDYGSKEDPAFTISRIDFNSNDVSQLVNEGKAKVVEDPGGALTQRIRDQYPDAIGLPPEDMPLDSLKSDKGSLLEQSVNFIQNIFGGDNNNAMQEPSTEAPAVLLPPVEVLEGPDVPTPSTEKSNTESPVSFFGIPLAFAQAPAQEPPPLENITVELESFRGVKSNPQFVLNQDSAGNYQVKLSNQDKNNFEPGKYHFRVKILQDDGTIVTLEKDFTWGVLAINTNKSIFAPGDDAYIQIGNLNQYGHTLCDSKLQLTIDGPDGTKVFKTSNNTITSSDTCGADNVTDSPDYYLHYVPHKVGTFQMNLKNLDNGFQVSDTFEVKQSEKFVVERISATRINPFKSEYDVNIRVTARNSFSGVFTESVPDSFEITDQGGGELGSAQNVKTITWSLNLLAGGTKEFTYRYQSPLISPEFYLLGPARILGNNGAEIWREARQWQIASDSTCTMTTAGTWDGDVNTDATAGNSGTARWTGCSAVGFTPRTTDDVQINANQILTISGNASINGLTLINPAATGANSLIVQTTRTLTLAAGVVYGNNSGALNSTIELDGTAIMNVGTTFDMGIPASTGLNRVITNAGTVCTTCQLNVTGLTSVKNASTATAGTDSISIGPGTFSTGTLTFTNTANGTGQALVTATTGTLTMNGAVTFSITAAETALTTTGAGKINLNGSTLGTGGTVTIFAATTLTTTGTSSIANYASASWGVLTMTSGTLAIPASTFTDVVLTAGTATLSGAVTVSGNFTNNTGSASAWGGAFKTTFTGAATKTITGSTTFDSVDIGAAAVIKVGASTTMTVTNNFTALQAATVITQFSTDNSGAVLTVSGSMTLNDNSATNAVTWAVGQGTWNIAGEILLTGTSATCTNRKGIITVATSGTLNANGGIDTGGTGASTNACNNIDMSSGTGTFNLKGAVNANNVANVGTGWTFTMGTLGSTFAYVDSAQQTVTIPGAGLYNNLLIMNTNASGASLGAALTSTSLSGNLTVGDGTTASVLFKNGSANIAIANGKTFRVKDKATFQMDGTTATYPTAQSGSFTSTFDCTTIASACSTVIYNQTSAQNISTQTYGHLSLTPAGTVTYTGQSGSLNVAGNLTVGNGSNILTFTNSGSDPTIGVTGDATFAASSVFVASDLNTMSVGGNWLFSGTTFTNTGSTVKFTSTATGKTINNGSASFNNVTFDGVAGAWSPLTNTMTVAGDLTMTNGTFDTSSGTANVTVNGAVKCGATCGTINMTATNTFTQSVAASAKNFGTDVAVATNWVFYDLTFTSNTGVTITTSSTGTGTIEVKDVMTISTNSTLAGGNRTFILSGAIAAPFVKTGTFTYNTSTINFTGNSASVVVNQLSGTGGTNGYYNLGIKPGGAVTYQLSSGTYAINNNLTIGDSSNAGIVSNTTNSPTVTVTGDLIMNTSATLSGSGTNTYTINGGDVTGDGTINLTGNTFQLNGTGNFGGATAWTFKNLNFGDTTTKTTTSTGAGNITITGTSVIFANQTLDSKIKTWTFSGSSATPFTINTGGVLNDSTDTGTFTFTGSSGSGVNIPSSTGFNNITVNNSAENYHMLGDITMSGTLLVTNGGFLLDTNSLTVAFVNIANSATATLNISSSFLNLTGSSGTVLTRGSSGVFTATSSTTIFNANADIATMTSGTFTSGNAFNNVTLSPAVTAARAYTFGTGAITMNGDFDIAPSTNAFLLTVNMGADITVAATGTTTIEGTTATSKLVLRPSGTDYNLSTGKLNIAANGTLDGTGAASTITATFATSGTTLTRAGTFTAGSTTVNLSGAGTQTVNSGAFTGSNAFYNFTESGTSTKTLGANIEVSHNLSVSSGTLQLSTFDLTVTGTTSIGGTLADSSSTGTNLFTGAVTINSGGIWNDTGGSAYEFRGGLTNDSLSGFTSGAGAYTFSTNAQTLSGSQSFTITAVTNTVPTSTGTGLTFSGAQPTVTTLTQGSTTTLTFSGTVPAITTLSATVNPNTVQYTGGTQTVKGTTYHHLTINGSGTATLGAATVANGNLTITAGTLDTSSGSSFPLSAATVSIATAGTLAINNSTLSVTGASGTLLTRSGAGVLTAGASSTVDLTGNGTATVNSGTFDTTNKFNTLTSSGTGTKTLGASVTINKDFNISSGTGVFADGGNQITGNSSGTLTLASGAQLNIGSGGNATTFPTSFTNAHISLNVASTVQYQADVAQTISSTPTYGNLSLAPVQMNSNFAYTFASGIVAINGNFSITPVGRTSTRTLTVTMAGAITVAATKTTTVDASTLGASILDTTGTNYGLSTGFLSITNNNGGGTLTANGSTITLTGTSGTLFTRTGTFTQGTSNVTVSGSGSTTLMSGTATFHILTINPGVGNTITAGAAITFSNANAANKLDIQSGKFNDGGSQITGSSNGTLAIASSAELCIGGNTSCTTSFTTATTLPTFFTYSFNSASTVSYLANDAQIVDGTPTYGNLQLIPVITAGRIYTFESSTTPTIVGNFTINPTASSALALTVKMAGNITVASGKLTTITGTTSGTSSLITKPSATSYDLSTGLIAIGSAGTLDANGATSNITLTAISGTPFTNSGIFSGGNSTVKFKGDADLTLLSGSFTSGNSFYNFDASPALTTSRTYTLGAALNATNNYSVVPTGGGSISLRFNLGGATTVSGTLLIQPAASTSVAFDTTVSNHAVTAGAVDNESGGVIRARNSNVSVSGNWTNNGSFTSDTSTVILSGINQTLTGSTSFYDLTKQENTNDSTDSILTIAASSTQTVTHTLDFDGLDTNDQLNLVSSTPTTRYTFDFTSSQVATWLDVTDSNASSSSITCTDCVNGGNNDDGEAAPHWIFVASGFNVAGFVLQTDETTGDAGTICDGSADLALRVDGGTAVTTTCTSGTGAFTFTGVSATSGQIITIYSTNTKKANTVYVSDGTVDSGVNVYWDTVGFTYMTGSSITNADIDAWDSTNDATNMLYDSNGTNMTVASGYELHIETGKTFAPGGTVTTTASSSPSSKGGDVHIDGTGTLSMGANSLSVGGDFNNEGTLTVSFGQTTTFTATATGFVITDGGENFYHIIFNGASGGWSFADATILDGDLTMTNGTLSGTNNITVNGGDVTGNGTINITGGTFLVDGTGSFGGSTAWNFSTLTFGDGSGTTTTTASGAGTITAAGAMTIAANQTLANSATFHPAGNYTNNGTLTDSSGTFVFNGTSLQTLSGTLNGSSSFFNITLSNASADPSIIFSGPLTATGLFDVETASVSVRYNAGSLYTFNNITWNGQATGTRVKFRSSVADTRWDLNVSGTQSVLNTDAQDSDASFGNLIDSLNASNHDSGNNTNWNFLKLITLSISDSTIGFGSLSDSAARFATGDNLGNGSETEAHTMTASSNATGGYTITVFGPTLTSGANTIAAIGGTNTGSNVGTEQFGLRLAINSGSGSVSAPYAASGFAYDGASSPSQVATGAGDSVDTIYSARYLANITSTTPAGSYSTNLTFVVAAPF